MAAAIAALGADVVDVPTTLALGSTSAGGDDWLVTPGPLRGPAQVDCGLAGTVMRFLPPVAALADGDIRFDGDPRARERPMGPVVRALRDLGVEVDDGGTGLLPFTVRGQGPRPRRHDPDRRVRVVPVRLRRCCSPGPGSTRGSSSSTSARRSRASRTSS